MPTLKKFLHYYKPHKAMLIFDLICATIVSLVDISFPQILNVLNKSLFTMDVGKSALCNVCRFCGRT